MKKLPRFKTEGEEIKFWEAHSISVLFIETYRKLVKQAFLVTTGRLPEKLNDMITAVPWRYL